MVDGASPPLRTAQPDFVPEKRRRLCPPIVPTWLQLGISHSGIRPLSGSSQRPAFMEGLQIDIYQLRFEFFLHDRLIVGHRDVKVL